MDFGLFCDAKYLRGQRGYFGPLRDDQASVYEDGRRYVYTVADDQLDRFSRWVHQTFTGDIYASADGRHYHVD
jgi:hypothetical protein